MPEDSNPSNTLMPAPQGEVELHRSPPNPMLQAWDAADLYLLNRVDELQVLSRDSQILAVNDSFGAISVSLAGHHPTVVNDSFLGELAIRRNLQLNGYELDQIRFSSGIELPQQKFNLVLIKIPKSLALLEHELYMLRAAIDEHTRVIAAGMTRNIHSSTLKLFEQILGPTITSLAWKKSRLIYVERDNSLNQGRSPYPDSFIVETDREFEISNNANLFSREKLDVGSRLLIENMPVSSRYLRIADLGCGNGILGLIAASLNPQAELLFVDESYSAVDSARKNFETAFAGQRHADFRVTDCFQGIEENSIDLVLNNPPFHQQHSVGDSIAWQMFKDARKVLKVNGELWVVGNRHLAYHAKLKKIFGNCQQIASNRKFVVVKAIKP